MEEASQTSQSESSMNPFVTERRSGEKEETSEEDELDKELLAASRKDVCPSVRE